MDECDLRYVAKGHARFKTALRVLLRAIFRFQRFHPEGEPRTLMTRYPNNYPVLRWSGRACNCMLVNITDIRIKCFWCYLD